MNIIIVRVLVTKLMFPQVSVCLSAQTGPTPPRATYAAGGMPLAVTQKDFLVFI